MKPSTIPHRGMLADNVLKLRGRSVFEMIADPSLLGRDTNGNLQPVFHYEDCDVILGYWEGGFRVKEVVLLREVD